jgi:hypothetical protein
MAATRSEGVNALAPLDHSIEWRRRWADNLFSLVAFIGPVVFVSASMEAGSFRPYLPAFFFGTAAGSVLILALRRGAGAMERRRARVAAQLRQPQDRTNDREELRRVA